MRQKDGNRRGEGNVCDSIVQVRVARMTILRIPASHPSKASTVSLDADTDTWSISTKTQKRWPCTQADEAKKEEADAQANNASVCGRRHCGKRVPWGGQKNERRTGINMSFEMSSLGYFAHNSPTSSSRRRSAPLNSSGFFYTFKTRSTLK